MKLQLFSTERTPATGPYPLFADPPAAVFPALQLTTSSLTSISMITAYGIRARLTTFAPKGDSMSTQPLQWRFRWLWTVLEKPRHMILLWPACRGVYGQTVAADATTGRCSL